MRTAPCAEIGIRPARDTSDITASVMAMAVKRAEWAGKDARKNRVPIGANPYVPGGVQFAAWERAHKMG